jgi:hypothetical protein
VAQTPASPDGTFPWTVADRKLKARSHYNMNSFTQIRRYARALFIAAVLCLTAARLSPSAARSPGVNAKNAADLVPTGYKIEQEARGDLNKDGLDDYVFIISEKRDKSRRGIVIAFNKSEHYETALENRNIFSYDKDLVVGTHGPDYFEAAVKKGVLDIKMGTWHYGCHGEEHYKFMYRNNDFVLIGYDSEVICPVDINDDVVYVRRGTTSIIFLSKKMCEKTNIADEKSDEERFEEEWKDIIIKEPIILRTIDDLSFFSMEEFRRGRYFLEK